MSQVQHLQIDLARAKGISPHKDIAVFVHVAALVLLASPSVLGVPLPVPFRILL